MNRLFALIVLICASVASGACSDYDITILGPNTPNALYRPEYEPSTKLVGKTIAGVFGPISEIRIELQSAINLRGIENDPKKLDEEIRTQIDHATCLGRASEVAWHQAPWLNGYILLENGRILPVDILLDAVIVGELLFADKR